MIDTTDNERLIARYLNGDLSAGEREALIRWMEECPGNKKQFFELKDIWDASSKRERQETDPLLQFYKKQAVRKPASQRKILLAGIAIAAMLMIGLLIHGILPGQKSVSHLESFTVPLGSRSQLTLSDGTKVNLNSDSHLELADNFSSKNRTVSLTGEGYFEVKSDKEHPFTVKTDKFNIKVTGTKFNVNSYSDDENVSATLAEGHIQLSAKNQETYILTPGEKISFNQKTMSPSREKADVEAELAWVNGEFIFKQIPFPDLIRRLERWYDVTLLYKGSEFDTMLYSGRFKNQETIWQVLDALKLTSPIDYKKSNFRKFELIYKPM